MLILFVVLIVLACAILGFIVLIQNPKGGGLAGNVAGFNTQFMGVKQTNDVLEKGTWIFSAVIGGLCLFSMFFINPSGRNENNLIKSIDTKQRSATPSAPPAQLPQQPAK
jgi:preprotein translocase subunit SecG